MTVEDRLRLAWLGAHPERARGWRERYGSAGAVLRAIGSGGIEIGPALREAATVLAAARCEELAALGVIPVFRGAAGYPAHLAELPDAPDLLFCRGGLPEQPGVAVVGSRQASAYGLQLAEAFGRAVAGAGWPVVSGLARGVDGAAHRGTVGVGIGVAVLGCGPDVWYPAHHQQLGERLVAEGGAVVTEYPPGTPPEGWRFPPRNRIISGLSGAVVVVEATERGGALITARTALEQGRAVFVVPGDVDRPTSKGCNLLIRDGAHPVLGPEDLIEEVSLVLGRPPRAVRQSVADDPLIRQLGEVGTTIEELATALDLPVPQLLARLSRLEAEGVVRIEEGMVMPRG
ncbi:MAG: DNA-processing protein DprA [Acidimicrobiia bacterium]